MNFNIINSSETIILWEMFSATTVFCPLHTLTFDIFILKTHFYDFKSILSSYKWRNKTYKYWWEMEIIISQISV